MKAYQEDSSFFFVVPFVGKIFLILLIFTVIRLKENMAELYLELPQLFIFE